MRPSGVWGPNEFAQFTDDELHETMMGAEPGSNYFEWAKAELQHRDRRRAQNAARPSHSNTSLSSTDEDQTLRTQAPAGGIQKTVFISYRRHASAWAQSIFQNLTQHGYDVFFDFQNIASGGFEEVVFENITARAHFLVLLTPSALERCRDPHDLFRREIETALALKRNIVPILLDDFSFGAPEIDDQLGPSLLPLKQYNGLTVYPAYFSEAMQRLRDKFLNVPLNTVIHPLSVDVARAAREDQAAAAKAPAVTEKELREAAQPRYVFTVKNKYEDELERPEGTRAEEPNGPGSLILYDGEAVVARYNNVERWSRQRKN